MNVALRSIPAARRHPLARHTGRDRARFYAGGLAMAPLAEPMARRSEATPR